MHVFDFYTEKMEVSQLPFI